MNSYIIFAIISGSIRMTLPLAGNLLREKKLLLIKMFWPLFPIFSQETNML